MRRSAVARWLAIQRRISASFGPADQRCWAAARPSSPSRDGQFAHAAQRPAEPPQVPRWPVAPDRLCRPGGPAPRRHASRRVAMRTSRSAARAPPRASGQAAARRRACSATASRQRGLGARGSMRHQRPPPACTSNHAHCRHRHRNQLAAHDRVPGPAGSVVRGHRSGEGHGPTRHGRTRRPAPGRRQHRGRALDTYQSSCEIAASQGVDEIDRGGDERRPRGRERRRLRRRRATGAGPARPGDLGHARKRG